MAQNHANVISVAASTSLTVYTAVFAATPFNTNKIVIANGGNSGVTLAIGAAGSEVDFIAVSAGQTLAVPVSQNTIGAGARLSICAAGAVNSSGFVTVSLLP